MRGWDAGHRAYAPPRSPWAIAMSWRDLLFMHWAVDAEALRRVVPSSLPLDLQNGRAYVGVVPFEMVGTRLRCLPAMHGTHAFPELNVRTYVTLDGRPGVYFFSLDAGSKLAVRAARRGFGLPYFDARMRIGRTPDGWIDYKSSRTQHGAPPAEFAARYRPIAASPGGGDAALEAFLTERYCLYTVDGAGRPRRGEIHHVRWPLQPAECVIRSLDMTRLLGIALPDTPPLLHFAQRLDVVAWLPRRVRATGDHSNTSRSSASERGTAVSGGSLPSNSSDT